MTGPSEPGITVPPDADRLRVLQEICRAISASLDLRSVFDTIYEHVSRLWDITSMYVAFHDPGSAVIDIPFMNFRGELHLDQSLPYESSLTRRAIETGSSYHFHTDTEYRACCRRLDVATHSVGDSSVVVNSLMISPMKLRNRSLGTLTVGNVKENAFTMDDAEMMSIIASQAAVAIENARLFQESDRSVRRMEALLRAAHTILGSHDLQTVLSRILASMSTVVPYFRASIMLPNASKYQLYVAGCEGTGSVGKAAALRGLGQSFSAKDGVAGTIFCSGQPLIVPDVRELSSRQIQWDSGARAEMGVPLRRGDQIVGVLDVERLATDSFTSDELDLLTLFASQAAVALENARLFEEQHRRVSELQVIGNIVQRLSPLRDIEQASRVVEEEVGHLIGFRSLGIYVLDSSSRLNAVIMTGSDMAPRSLALGESVSGWVAEHAESISIPNSLEDERAYLLARGQPEPLSVISAPIIYLHSVRGVITLTKPGARQFDENALRVLEIIAAQVANSFDRIRLFEHLRSQAITDELTKLYNRRYLLERFKEETTRARRNRQTLVVLMIDIDHFKSVNDVHGHQFGDMVLRELSTITRSLVRAEDVVARYGGEEFCILLPDIALEQAKQVACRLRDTIEQHQLPAEVTVNAVTVSIGLSVLEEVDSGTEIFSRADLAMYEGKRSGGNRVCMATPDGRFILLSADPN